MAQGATDASARLNAQLGVQREQAAGPLRSAAQAEAAPAPAAGRRRPRSSPSRPVPRPSRWRRIPSSRRRCRPSAWTTPRTGRRPTRPWPTPVSAPSSSSAATNRSSHRRSRRARRPRRTRRAPGPSTARPKRRCAGESRAQAEARLGGGLTGMRAQRLDLIGQVVGEQESTRTHQSQQRRLVTERVAAIKEATRHDVEVILTAMDANAVAIFEVGLREAEGAYEDAFEEAKGGIGNWLTEWGSDWDELIEESLATGRAAYLERVGRAIDEVATLVESQLAAAKQRVAAGAGRGGRLRRRPRRGSAGRRRGGPPAGQRRLRRAGVVGRRAPRPARRAADPAVPRLVPAHVRDGEPAARGEQVALAAGLRRHGRRDQEDHRVQEPALSRSWPRPRR